MHYSLKNLIEWSEQGSPSRPRNLVLYSTVILYLVITTIFFFLSIWITIPAVTVNIYYSISAIFISVIGFFTTTHPKTAEILTQENQIKFNENQLNYFKNIFEKVLDKTISK